MTDTCGCCEGIEQITPITIINRPGLNALLYRVGTHATFFETMLARLSNMNLGTDANPNMPLQSLTTRSTSDPTIALLDAWAIMGAVFTFYQERIANEGYLRTATHRRSILELARLVGYKLRPGVASSTYLAYTLQTGYTTLIPAGSRAQNIPAAGQLPQSFETSLDLQARAAWNNLQPRISIPEYIIQSPTDPTAIDIDTPDGAVYLDGIATNLKPNDPVLFVFDDNPGDQVFAHVQSVTPYAAEKYTSVTFPIGFTSDVFNRNFASMINRYLNVAAFGLSAANPTVQQVVANLKSISPPVLLKNGRVIGETFDLLQQKYLNSWQEFYEQAAHVQNDEQPVGADSLSGGEVISRPSADQPVGADLSRPSVVQGDSIGDALLLASWLGALINDMASVLHTVSDLPGLETSHRERASKRSASNVFDEDIHPPVVTTGLGTLTAPLVQPTNQQPSRSANLRRSIQDAFARSGNIATQLLATFQPQLATALTAAYSSAQVTPPPPLQEFDALRVKAAPFGSSAPKQATTTESYDPHTDTVSFQTNYNEWSLVESLPSNVLDLDARYDHIVPETWVVIEATSALPAPFPTKAVKIQSVETVARADYGISAKVTRLTLYEPWLKSTDLTDNSTDLSLYRGITVYAQSETLPLADVPITDDIAGQDVELDSLYDGLQSGRYVVVSGERTDIPNVSGVTASELMMLASVSQDVHSVAIGSPPTTIIPLPGDTIHTTLHFATPLAYTYKRDSVVINGNVVAATQGETQNQVLGSGSGGTAMQQFTLAKSPLTYVPAVTPTGEESTLQVFINNIPWQEVDSLDTALATDRVYTTQADNQDKVTITFGNGVHGARLPTGNENVKAIYRTGIGTSGNVDIGKISQLVSKPLGVKGVNNPVTATGGADRESRDQARANVPLAATALGRIVSIQDYADFARTFAGIGKASAAYLSDGMQQVAHLTIAGQDDIPIDSTSALYESLLQSLHTFGDPGIPLVLALADVKLLIISTRVSIQPDYLFEDVSAALRSALLAAFSFEKRNLGQPVYQSEVLSVMQQAAGVAYVDIDILDAITQQQLTIALQQIQADALQAANTGQQPDNPPDLATLLGLKDRRVVPSALARPDEAHPGNILPAQMVFLSPDVQDTLILNQLTTLMFKPAKHKHHHAGTR